MPPLTAAAEARIVAARVRLAGAGYPADDLSDEEVWAGRRVWWGREAGWATVARECPEIAGAIVAHVADRPDWPDGLTLDIYIDTRHPVQPAVMIAATLRRSGRVYQSRRVFAPSEWKRVGSIPGWVAWEIQEAIEQTLNWQHMEQHEATHVTLPSSDPDNYMRYQPPRMP